MSKDKHSHKRCKPPRSEFRSGGDPPYWVVRENRATVKAKERPKRTNPYIGE